VRITWVLPRDHRRGVGGYAVVYGYANRLARRGHQVTVVHLDPVPRPSLRHPRAALVEVARWLGRLVSTPGADYSPDPALRRRSRPWLHRRAVAGSDAVVATAWRTAAPVAAVAPPPHGFYFIQHHETWDGPPREVDATWLLPLSKIVIAEWLADVAAELDALPVAHVPNAIDPAVHSLTVPPHDRTAASVAMLWHPKAWKRSRDGLAALALVREQVPDLVVDAFSISPRPDDVPGWVRWHHAASPAEVAAILNSAAVFLSPSEAEGWPLPPAEALACGCALVSTDIGGVRDYAHPGRTALLVPVGDVPAMADAVLRLVRDDALRLQLATAGAQLIAERFGWDTAVDRLLTALSGAGTPG